MFLTEIFLMVSQVVTHLFFLLKNKSVLFRFLIKALPTITYMGFISDLFLFNCLLSCKMHCIFFKFLLWYTIFRGWFQQERQLNVINVKTMREIKSGGLWHRWYSRYVKFYVSQGSLNDREKTQFHGISLFVWNEWYKRRNKNKNTRGCVLASTLRHSAAVH